MDLASKKAFELKMANKIAELQGKEAAPTPELDAAPTPVATIEAPEPQAAPEAGTEEPEPEAAPTADEWDDLKKEFGSAKAAREHLENLRSMQAEAHQRNADSAREKQEARMLFQQTQQLQAQMNAQTQALSQMGDADPAAAAQLLAAMGKRGAQPAGSSDPAVATVMSRLDEMDRMMNAQRFAHNQAITAQAAHSAVMQSEVLSGLAKIDATLAQEAAQEIVQKLYDRDMRSPGTVVPTNPATFAPVVAEAVRAIEKKYRTISEGGIKKWKADHALNAKKAPPSGKGPSASVRTAPAAPKPPPNMTMRARGDFLEKKMKATLESLKDS